MNQRHLFCAVYTVVRPVQVHKQHQAALYARHQFKAGFYGELRRAHTRNTSRSIDR